MTEHEQSSPLEQVEQLASAAFKKAEKLELLLRRYVREDDLRRHLDDIRKRGDDFAQMHNSQANKVSKISDRLRKVEQVTTTGNESAVVTGVAAEIAAAHGREAVEADAVAARAVLTLLRGEKS